MDYEKKYKEALERAKDLHNNHALGKPFIYKTCEDIFPELKESEDEKTKREIMEYITHYEDSLDDDEYRTWIAWLEKQGEQKYAWSKEDEVGLGDTMWAIEQAMTIAKNESDMGNLWYAERWLKSIKERMKGE